MFRLRPAICLVGDIENKSKGYFPVIETKNGLQMKALSSTYFIGN